MTDGNLGPAPSGRLLVFRVGTLACAAEVDQVREILPRLPTTRIPGAPPVVAGLVNVRGTLVTVVEGWRALGLPAPPSSPSPDAPAGSTIILEVARDIEREQQSETVTRRVIGFTVDEMLDMLAPTEQTLEDRQGLPGVDPTLVRAVGRRHAGGELFIVLDLAALLGPILTT